MHDSGSEHGKDNPSFILSERRGTTTSLPRESRTGKENIRHLKSFQDKTIKDDWLSQWIHSPNIDPCTHQSKESELWNQTPRNAPRNRSKAPRNIMACLTILVRWGTWLGRFRKNEVKSRIMILPNREAATHLRKRAHHCCLLRTIRIRSSQLSQPLQ